MFMLIVDKLAFKNINNPIKKQTNGCDTICVKQDDDPCHFLRLLYGTVAKQHLNETVYREIPIFLI